MIYDVENRAVGAIHAGRVGSKKNIVLVAIEKMIKCFNIKASSLCIYIGPFIHSCCYEVKEDVLDGVDKKYIVYKDKKLYLDLKAINIDMLLDVGVKKAHINDVDICTCCSKDYFSYRRDKTSNRFAGVVMIREL